MLTLALPDLKPDDRLLATGLAESFATPYRVGLGLALGITLGLIFAPYPLAWRLHGQGFLAALAISALVMPAVGQLLQSPVRQAGRIAASLQEPLRLHGVHTPSFQTYARRQVLRDPPQPGDVVLTRESHLSDLALHEVLFRERGYVLVRMR